MSVTDIAVQLVSGMWISFAIFALTLIFSLPLGLLISFGRMSKIKILSLIVRFYISVMRGTPLMLQLFVVYFGPYFLFGIRISSDYRFWAAIIGFVLNYAAYFAEIYRAGIEFGLLRMGVGTIDRGQYEAAYALGHSNRHTFFRIILPQVIKRILPPVTNEVITLVKDTSLAFVISVAEMFSAAKAIAAAQASVTALVVAGVFYYVFNLVVALIMDKIEKKLSYYR